MHYLIKDPKSPAISYVIDVQEIVQVDKHWVNAKELLIKILKVLELCDKFNYLLTPLPLRNLMDFAKGKDVQLEEALPMFLELWKYYQLEAY